MSFTCTSQTVVNPIIPILINLWQGKTFLYNGTITDSTGALLDLTGYSFAGCIRKSPTDAPIPFTFVVLNQTTYKGQFTASISPAVSEKINVNPYLAPNITFTPYLGEMNIIDPSGNIFPFAEFNVQVWPMVQPTNV